MTEAVVEVLELLAFAASVIFCVIAFGLDVELETVIGADSLTSGLKKLKVLRRLRKLITFDSYRISLNN